MLRFLQSFLHHDRALAPGVLMRAAGLADADYESAEEHLARDVQQMDIAQAGWAEDVAVQDAMHRLGLGMATSDAVVIFGAEVISQAYQRLAVVALEHGEVENQASHHALAL